MGQRQEKYKRQRQKVENRLHRVECRMAEVERKQIDSSKFSENLRIMSEVCNDLVFGEQQKRWKYQDEARRWKINAWLSLILLALVVAVCIVLSARQEPENPEPVLQEESLPGDDTPALVRCSMTEEEVEAAENEMIEAALLARSTRLDDVTVTHYDCCLECCGKDDGITESGLRATPGVTVAVDPDVIPLGADVLVDYGDGEIQYYRADDTGGAVKGNHIDVCVSSHEEAVEAGVKNATVWWVMPE